MWEWPSPAQSVPLSQATQAKEDREFLIYEGGLFCRLVGKISKLISERDMVVLKYKVGFLQGVPQPFFPYFRENESGDLVVFYASPSCSHVAQGRLVH